MAKLYWPNLDKFRLIFGPDVWGCAKFAPDILFSDPVACQDFSFLYQNKIDLIITSPETVFHPLTLSLLQISTLKREDLP
jgi:hypothetical protein